MIKIDKGQNERMLNDLRAYRRQLQEELKAVNVILGEDDDCNKPIKFKEPIIGKNEMGIEVDIEQYKDLKINPAILKLLNEHPDHSFNSTDVANILFGKIDSNASTILSLAGTVSKRLGDLAENNDIEITGKKGRGKCYSAKKEEEIIRTPTPVPLGTSIRKPRRRAVEESVPPLSEKEITEDENIPF